MAGEFGMGLPLLSEMSKATRVAYPFIEQMAATQLSANKILAHLSDAGLGIARTTGLAIIRALREQQPQRDYSLSLNYDVLPNPLRLTVTLTDTLRRYSYTVKIVGTHSITGERMEQFVTISSHDLLTKNAAIDVATGYLEGAPGNYNIEPDSYQVTAIKRNPKYPV